MSIDIDTYAIMIAAEFRRTAPRTAAYTVLPEFMSVSQVSITLGHRQAPVSVKAAQFYQWLLDTKPDWPRITAILARKRDIQNRQAHEENPHL